jgi:hypothetical protein
VTVGDGSRKAYMSGPAGTVFACDPGCPRAIDYRAAALVERSLPARRELAAAKKAEGEKRKAFDDLVGLGVGGAERWFERI